MRPLTLMGVNRSKHRVELLAALQTALKGTGVLRRVWAGASCAIQGALLVLRSPALLRLAMPAVLIHLAMYPVCCFGAWKVWPWLFEKVWTFEKPDGAVASLFYGLAYVLVGALLGLVLFLLALWLVNLVAATVASPFLDALSETTEGMLTRSTPRPSPPLWRGVWMSARSAFGLVAIYLPWLVLSVVLALVPVLGTVLGPLLHGGVTVLLVCVQLMEGCAQRHDMGLRSRLTLVRHNLPTCVGFGLVAWMFMFLPFSLPLLSAGGTVLFLALKPPAVE